MSKSRFVVLMIASLWLVGCGGSSSLEGEPGADPAAGQMECYGDPDAGGVICKPAGELWDCASMPNGEVKCRKTGFATPAGTASWTCTASGGKIVCATAAGNLAGGSTPGASVDAGSGWDCTSDGTTVTCTYTGGSSVPPGGGSWDCTVSEFGLNCTGTPGETGPGSTSSSSGPSGGEPPGGETPGGQTGGSGGWSGFACSYAMFVFTYQGKTYVMKINNGAVTCVGENGTSKDANFSYTCNGTSYDNQDFIFNMDGSPVAPFPGDCPANFSFSSTGVVAGPGINILFGVAHNGSFPNHFAELCPPAGGATSMSFPSICGGN